MQIKLLALTNFMSYESLRLELVDRGLVLIDGENGAGKSTIFEALYWCLFGKTARGLKSNQITRNDQGNTLVYCEIILPDTLLKVYRYRDHSKHGNKLLVYSNDVAMTMGSDSETQKRLDEFLQLNADTFQSVVMFPQNGTGFAAGSDAEQKNVLESVLGIERFAAAQERTKILKSNVDGQLSSVRASTTSDRKTITDLSGNIEDLELSERDFTAAKARALAKIDEQLVGLNTQLPAVDSALTARYVELLEEGNASKIMEARGLLQRTDNRVLALEKEKSQVQGQLESLELPDTDEQPLEPEHTAEYYKRDVDRLAKNINNFQARRELLGAEANALSVEVAAVVNKDKCEACGQGLSELAKVFLIGSQKKALERKQAEIAELKTGLISLNQDLDVVEGFYYCAMKYEEWWDAREVRTKRRTLQERIPAIDLKLESLKVIADSTREVVDEASKKLEEARAVKEILDEQEREVQQHEERVDRLAQDRKRELAQTSPYQTLIGKERGKLVEAKRRLSAKLAASIELEEQLEILKFWVAGFGNRGVKSLLLDTVTPFLNDRAGLYLSSLTNSQASVRFNTQTTLASGELRDRFSVDVSYVGGADRYKGISGGERRRVDIATLLALGDLAASRALAPVRLRLLDEPFDGLDPVGCEQVASLLKSEVVSRAGTVLVMSHTPEMKSLFDSRITVLKEHGVSKLSEDL